MIKPVKTLLLLIYICLLLGLLSFLPEEVVLLGNQKIKIPKITAIFQQNTPQYADISAIKDKFENTKDSKKSKKKKKSNSDNYVPYVPDSLKLNPELRIQYPKDNDTILYAFFRGLKVLDQKKELLRVLHYGDSQLEGDRITAFLRDKFQQEFGGCGVGIATIVDKLHTKASIYQTADASWSQFAIFGGNYRRNTPNFYGILGDYYKFYIPDSDKTIEGEKTLIKKTATQTPIPKTVWTKASVSYLKSPMANPRQEKVESIKVLYRNPEAPFELTIQAQNDSLKRVEIEPNKEFDYYEYRVQSKFEGVKISFAGGIKSPEVYGVALDCNQGITFDNIPLRGSSGVEFTRINREHLKKQYEKLNVKFLILQFGVNIVPYVIEDYSFYESQFYEQLKFLKNLSPDLSILVVGVSDMSRNTGKGYESYPNIEKIRNAQKKAAFKAGCAFWDLYEAMGGKNSMPSWVFANPSLASKDFTHFTAKGAEIVSEMLYKALLSEYDKFNQVYY